MPSKPMDQKERMRNNVQEDAHGCWVWQSTKDRIGYGRVKVSLGSRSQCVTKSAHRYAHELWIGAIPAGMSVLHRCDNRACCNPKHLFIGTQGDNMRDMHAKGRGPRGYRRNASVCASNARRRTAAIDAAIGEKA